MSNNSITVGDTVTLQYRIGLGNVVSCDVTIVTSDEHDPSHYREGRVWAEILKGMGVGDHVVLPLPEENVLTAEIVDVKRPAN